MTKHSDTIIINGQHFNARTGHALESKVAAPVAVNVDGILPKHVTGANLQKPIRPSQPLQTAVTHPVMDIARGPAKHLPKRQTQPGQTLMRRALAKPTPTLKRTTKVAFANQTKASVTIAHVTKKSSATVVDDRKLSHAKKVAQSEQIKRFVKGQGVKTAKALSAAQVAEAGKQAVKLAKQPSHDLFERALASAVSHQQATPPHVHKRLKQAAHGKRLLNLAASLSAVAIIAGFVGYQNLPAIKLQYASNQAGFRAHLPGYKPSGFSVGALTYQTGAISVNYQSNSDVDRKFAITQRPSAWDSQTLRENFLANSGQQYRTTEIGGQTIYLYGENNATWVDGGVWYQVETDGSLNERQVTELATSI